MWVIEWLTGLLLFPIEWFWNQYEKIKAQKCIWKLVAFFGVSLVGFCSLIYVLILGGVYVWANYRTQVLIGCGIISLYAYVRHKIKNKSIEQNIAPQNTSTNNESLYQKIGTRMKMVAKIMLFVNEKVATKLHCVVASREEEIIDTSYPYDIIGNVAFYVVRFEKEDIGEVIDENNLKLFIRILQAKLDHLTGSLQFRDMGFPTNCDSFGEPLTRICVDRIWDKGQYLYVLVTFDSPEYRDFLYQNAVAQGNNQISTTLPDANWDELNG